jgi:hypothetical protein
MISHHHQAIYIHIPKCAGQSVEMAFLKSLGLDWDRRAPLLLHSNNQPLIGPKRLAHLTAKEYKQAMYVTEQQFETYYKFATVRNPYSRAVSLFNHMQATHSTKTTARSYLGGALSPRAAVSFKTFWDDVIEPAFNDARQKTFGTLEYYKGDYWFVRPQSEFIYDHRERLVADILRLETLSQSWTPVANKFGLAATLPSANQSKRVIRLEDLTDAHMKKIRERYASDFELLGYEL